MAGAPIANPWEEKRIIVKIPGSAIAEEVDGQSREEIVKRIMENAGATQGNHYVVAV
jgi:chorismate mutase